MNNSNFKNKTLSNTKNEAKGINGFYLSYYLSPTFYIIGAIICLVFALSFFFSVLFFIAKILTTLLVIFTLLDSIILYAKSKGLQANRICNERFSNGDDNSVKINLSNNYFLPIVVKIIEELPAVFLYNIKPLKKITISPLKQHRIQYYVKPFNRGEYDFGSTLAFVSSPIKLVTRRYNFNNSQIIYVYPSYIQMQKYSLQGVSSNSQNGSKKVRKLGNSLEFEQIKDYVQGDDYRTINWKATARKSQLMVNTYVDEKSQQVFCLIDKSRNMKMPFEGMTLLDYSINASLALSNIAIQKQDKVGLISFAKKMDNFVQADSKPMQMEALLQSLYKQNTQFKDADYEALYAQIRGRIKQRSLLLLFTNFESEYSLQRQLPYLKAIAHYHLLVVVFFENTELKKMLHNTAQNTEQIYIQTIAEKFMYEKKLMLKELRANGITAILTTPAQLTVSTINKYLEIKNRQQL